MYISLEENQGGFEETNIIFLGIVCLLNIIFSFALFLLAGLMLGNDLKKEPHKLKKLWIPFVPAYFAMQILVIFLTKNMFSPLRSYALSDMGDMNVKLAGTAITSIIFLAIALMALIVYAFIKNLKNFKPVVLSTISCVFVVITMACAFAPLINVKLEVKPTDVSSKKIYVYKYNAGLIGNADLNNKEKNSLEQMSNDEFAKLLDNLHEKSFMDNTNRRRYYKSESAKENMENFALMCVIGREEYMETQALSLGYYLIIPMFVFSGVILALDFAIMFGFKGRKLYLSSKIILVTLLLGVLACVSVFVGFGREGLSFSEIDNIVINIGAASVVMAISSLLGIGTIFFENIKKKKEIRDM